jgi:hypothetical protein
MEKKNLDFKLPENVIVDIMGQDVTVRPYLTMVESVALINNYLKEYFSPETKSLDMPQWAAWDAEYSLTLALVDLLTDIKIDETVAFENLFYSGDFLRIREEIINFYEFRELLDRAVEDVKAQIEQKRSIGWAIDTLYSKLEGLLEQVSESVKNLNPEMLDKLKETGNSLIEKLAENPTVKEVFADQQRNK